MEARLELLRMLPLEDFEGHLTLEPQYTWRFEPSLFDILMEADNE